MNELARDTATVVGLVGVLVIVLGIGLAGVLAARSALRAPQTELFQPLRQRIGRSILLGLELLVAADIIRTVAETTTWTNVGMLAAIVVIRTFLSFTLEIELSGRLPWRADHEPGTTGGRS